MGGDLLVFEEGDQVGGGGSGRGAGVRNRQNLTQQLLEGLVLLLENVVLEEDDLLGRETGCSGGGCSGGGWVEAGQSATHGEGRGQARHRQGGHRHRDCWLKIRKLDL